MWGLEAHKSRGLLISFVFLFQAGNLTVLATDALLHQDPVQLDFHFRLTPQTSVHWHGLLCDRQLFLDIPYRALDQGNQKRCLSLDGRVGRHGGWGFTILSCHHQVLGILASEGWFRSWILSNQWNGMQTGLWPAWIWSSRDNNPWEVAGFRVRNTEGIIHKQLNRMCFPAVDYSHFSPDSIHGMDSVS